MNARDQAIQKDREASAESDTDYLLDALNDPALRGWRPTILGDNRRLNPSLPFFACCVRPIQRLDRLAHAPWDSLVPRRLSRN